MARTEQTSLEHELLGLTDETLQTLVAASWAFERNDHPLARRLVSEALVTVRTLADRVLADMRARDALTPGALRNDTDEQVRDAG